MKILGFLGLLLAALSVGAACTPVDRDRLSGFDCAEGTHPEGEACVPDTVTACGEGTFESNGECLPFDPNDTQAPTTTADPAGGKSRTVVGAVTLETDEPATVHFTVDGSAPTSASPSEPSPVTVSGLASGSTLRFFAVDPTGNEEVEHGETYVVDQDPPAPVTNLAATIAGANVSLTWTNPADADLAGVVVVRRRGAPVTGVPTPGGVLVAGDTLAPDEDVVFVGNADDFLDTSPGVGFPHYAVFAVDDVENYSAPAEDSLMTTVPAQTATISVTVGMSPVVTVNPQPANYLLSGTAVYDDAADTLTVSLTVQSEVGRYVFNPKLVVNTLNEGAVTADGVLGGKPYRYFGPEALAPGASATRDLVITGVLGGTSPIVLNVALADHPMLALQKAYTASLSMLVDTGALRAVGLGAGVAYSVDGRFQYSGSRTSGAVRMIDTASLTLFATKLIGNGIASVPHVAVDPNGQWLYAVLNANKHHYYRCSSPGPGLPCTSGDSNGASPGGARVELVRLDALTLEETGRLLILSESAALLEARGRPIALSPDGTLGALPIDGEGKLHLIDLATFTEIDSDSATAGIQAVDVTTTNLRVTTAAIAPDKSAAFVGYNQSDGRLSRVDLSTFAVTSLPPAVTSTPIAGGMAFAPNGELWAGRVRGNPGPPDPTVGDGTYLSIWTLAGPTEARITLGGVRATSVSFSGDGTRAFVALRGSSTIGVLDVATKARIDVDGDAANGITDITLPAAPGGQLGAISPF